MFPPDLKATYGRQFHRGMARELKVIKVDAYVKFPHREAKIPLPSPCFVCKESMLGHDMISVKM